MILKVTKLVLALVVAASSEDTLGSFNVYRDNITLSGYSSGGTMAQTLQISYSSLFSGIAVFSHTYYRCGPPDGDIDEYDRYCTNLSNLTNKEIYNPNKVHDDIKDYFAKGLIEDPKNLKDTKLYVYTGLRNVLFTPLQSLNILRVYDPYIQNPGKIKVRIQDSTQLLPSNSYGGRCNESAEETDFIGNCGFSGVTEAINFILFDDSNAPDAFQIHNVTRGNVSTFDQTEFTKDLMNHNMDDVGYYYVPTQCQSTMNQCYLHFYFHGCLSGREFNGPRHVENSGFLELAERKGIIMVFPQAKSSAPNPIGCWDTFGVSGKEYATQKGAQVTAVKRMLDRILEGPEATFATTTIAPVEPSSSTTSPAAARIALARAQRAQKLRENFEKRKLTYLPPPPEPAVAVAPVPLRRSAYKAVKPLGDPQFIDHYDAPSEGTLALEYCTESMTEIENFRTHPINPPYKHHTI